ncbi:ubiquinone biosynthesis monooxygenase COQ6 [Verruconis gallopava]|uniref:Ubiquinone biosynthesis monooxygenase COQ6, mitochondrial n=1 Tax=Verruconis gallopava TaxID=253628 RepID=A0A0D1Z3R1_9PEZI|nr:ubiquinone biosynthesis monooxygenase COQ6 [Verruconis gallopava]KIW07607.1 ubiquinone biosynthesis monooxygenase COQ6 [Verruconis gallopava]
MFSSRPPSSWLVRLPHHLRPLCYGQLAQARSFSRSARNLASEPELYDVVCVGGGPAGLSLAAGLKASPIASNLKVALVESLDLSKTKLDNSSPTRYSNRCSSLTPASVRFLQEAGVWEHVDQARVQPYQAMQVWDGITGSRISFDWAQAAGGARPVGSRTIAYMIENLNLTTALQKRLAELGGVDVISPVKVDSIEFGKDTPALDLRSWPILTLSNGDRLGARLLVGADGANSPVRNFAGIESRGWDYGRMGVVATIQLEGEGWGGSEHKIAYQRFLPTGPVAMLPLPGNMATLVWSTLPDRAMKLKQLKPDDFCAMVNAAFRLSMVDIDYMHTISEGQRDEFDWRMQHTATNEQDLPMRVVGVQEGTVAPFPLKLRHADSYVMERIALVGDAAHTIHPLAGQGLNQGQADVASLVKVIEDAVESGADIGSQISLERYNSERYAANNAMLGVCDKLHKLYSFKSGPIVPLRSLGLQAVDKLSFLKGFLMSRAAGGA